MIENVSFFFAGEKPYKCKICNRSFASSSTLTTHTRIHTGEKPYNCTVCDKSFARYDLTAHIRTHTGEKPYNCSTCQKRFTTSGQLTQHARVHTGERPFKCEICHKSCSSSTYLKKHKKNHCSGMPVPKVISKPKLESKQTTNDEIITSDIIDESRTLRLTDGNQQTVYIRFENVNVEQTCTVDDDHHNTDSTSIETLNNLQQTLGNGRNFIEVINDGTLQTLTVNEILENTSDVMMDIDVKQNLYTENDSNVIQIKTIERIDDLGGGTVSIV